MPFDLPPPPPAIVMIEEKGDVPILEDHPELRYLDEYPEIFWLANNAVVVTQEDQAAHESLSEILFGERYIEFDRTLMTLRCFDLLCEGTRDAYEQFSSAQKPHVKLSFEEFKKLSNQIEHAAHTDLWSTSVDLRRLVTAGLVLGDLGKSSYSRRVFAHEGATAHDHDDFHEEMMQVLSRKPHLSPTFEALDLESREILVRTANIGHFGHITHLECDQGGFEKLKKSDIASKHPFSLFAATLIYRLDTAGALGHVNNHSSLVYTSETHKAIQLTHDACFKLARSDIKTAYFGIVSNRALALGLDPEIPSDQALARIGAMMRLFTPADGQDLKKAFCELDDATQELIIQQFAMKENARPGRTPTYMPALLVNLMNHPLLGDTKSERLQEAFRLGVPFIVRVLNKGMDTNKVPVCFNPIAGVVKKDPYILERTKFNIEPNGDVKIR